MTQFKRIFLIVVDSFGIGAMPNAKEYGDEGADTFGHIDLIMNPFHIDTTSNDPCQNRFRTNRLLRKNV